MPFRRYAVYDLPQDRRLSECGANWLGWDAITGKQAAQPVIRGIAEVTHTAQKYGFHATLKPPFRLADNVDEKTLIDGLNTLANDTAPAVCNALRVSRIGRFLALTPRGNTSSINQLAFRCVTSLEPYRAPLNGAELAHRRTSELTPRQEQLLQQWGYPYVDDEFNYHITLTSKLKADALEQWHEIATGYFDLGSPYLIGSIALAGERDDGFFELVKRFPLTGQ